MEDNRIPSSFSPFGFCLFQATVQFHRSTVTQLEFSHNDRYLLSVSRARTIAVFEIDEAGLNSFIIRATHSPPDTGDSVKVDLIAKSIGHGRMIWTCSWSHDDRFFATGSRDVKTSNVSQSSLLAIGISSSTVESLDN